MIDKQKWIVTKIQELVNQGNQNFILYPFGEQGRQVKSILNVYFEIEEYMIIDNYLAQDYPKIKKIEELKDVDLWDKTILLTSDNRLVYDELVSSLLQVVPNANYIELFPNFHKEEQKKNYNVRKQVLDKIKRVSLVSNNMCYKPQKTKSIVFLPYVYMDLIQKTIFLTDDYFERDILNRIFYDYNNGKLSQIVKNGIVLDIGANIGNHSLYFANELGAKKVIAFEPVEETAWILEENVKINNLEYCIEIHKKGLSDIKGMASIVGYDYENIGMTAISSGDGDISMVTLDDFGFTKVAFIKIDVEGMELKVLKGGYETIKNTKPYIFVESFKNNFYKVNEFLKDLGYGYIEMKSSNYLFYPNVR